MTPLNTVQNPGPARRRKARVFTADGHFLIRATPSQVDHLLAAGLAEWRGDALRMHGASTPQSILANKLTVALAAAEGDQAAGGGAR